VRNVIKKINYLLNYISSFLLGGLMLMTVADVVSRRFFNAPIRGTFELTLLTITVIVYLGFAHANDYKEHIVIDVLYDALPHVGKRIFSMISAIISLALSALMAAAVYEHIFRLHASGATSASLQIPMWPIAITAFVGLVALALSFIGDVIFIFHDKGVLSNDPN